jgi:hypothetical protein
LGSKTPSNNSLGGLKALVDSLTTVFSLGAFVVCACCMGALLILAGYSNIEPNDRVNLVIGLLICAVVCTIAIGIVRRLSPEALSGIPSVTANRASNTTIVDAPVRSRSSKGVSVPPAKAVPANSLGGEKVPGGPN